MILCNISIDLCILLLLFSNLLLSTIIHFCHSISLFTYSRHNSMDHATLLLMPFHAHYKCNATILLLSYCVHVCTHVYVIVVFYIIIVLIIL